MHLEPRIVELYEVITKMHNSASYSIQELCGALSVSRSGLYAHAHKPLRARIQKNAQLRDLITQLFSDSRSTYGVLRIQFELRRQGLRCGKNRIMRLMRQLDLRVRQKRRYRPRTTDSRHGRPVAPNRLQALPEPVTELNQVWSADITYLPTLQDGWLYLAAEMDLCSRRILGWKLSYSLAAPLVSDTFQRALERWPRLPQIHHSDRGSQYASAAFQDLLESHHVQPSMSRKANCYDNATTESFWATLKTECFGHTIPANYAEVHSKLFDYIETFYNPRRIHSALGYLSPIEFENTLTSLPKPNI